MEFELLPALIAGIAGAGAMAVMMAAAKATGATDMDMPVLEGAFITGDRGKAKVVGLVMHVVVMGGAVFGVLYAGLFAVLDVDSANAWWYALIIGSVHALIAGLAMVVMPMIHPRVSVDPQPQQSDGALQLRAPGVFAKNMGKATPVGLVMGHLLYGLVVAVVYAALV